jgi:hypothetical protein
VIRAKWSADAPAVSVYRLSLPTCGEKIAASELLRFISSATDIVADCERVAAKL